MDYREGYIELLAERSGLKAKNKELFAALDEMIEQFQENEQYSDDDAKVINKARYAVAKGGE